MLTTASRFRPQGAAFKPPSGSSQGRSTRAAYEYGTPTQPRNALPDSFRPAQLIQQQTRKSQCDKLCKSRVPALLALHDDG